MQEKQMSMSSDQFQQTLAENIRQFNASNAGGGGGGGGNSSASTSNTTTSPPAATLENDINKYINTNLNGKPINGAPPYNKNLTN